MVNSLRKDRPVAIVGAGAWGLSTALHLNSAGYTDITVFERSPRQPSRYSAANDLNKIVRAEYEDRFYTELALVCFMILFIPSCSFFSSLQPFLLSDTYS